MADKNPTSRVGYTRREFQSIFQIYSANVYRGVFRDFLFTECNGRYYLSFREDAGLPPLITVEKRPLGPEKALFVATTLNGQGTLKEVARSEKLDNFIAQLKSAIDALALNKGPRLKAIY